MLSCNPHNTHQLKLTSGLFCLTVAHSHKGLKKKSCWHSFCFPLTYCTGEFACALLQQSDYLSLLSGGASAADHSGTLARELHEFIFIILQANLREDQQNGLMKHSGAHM